MFLILREELICLIILIFLSFYYSNNKIKEKGQPFGRIINYSVLYVFFDMITVITVNNQEIVHESINNLAHYIFYLLGVLVGFSYYIYAVKMVSLYESERILKKIGYFPIPIYLLCAIKYPVEYTTGMYSNYSSGKLAYITYCIFLGYCIVGSVLLFVYRKRIDERVKNAIFPMVFALCTSVIVQAFCPELLMTGGSATLLCLGIFVALDNPDKKYKEQALWDFLTGLKNRNSYDKEVMTYENMKKKDIGVFVADLNNLKKINDSCGHEAGDDFISTAAHIIKDCLKSADSVYRIGGDEFVAIFINPNEEQIQKEMHEIKERCDKEMKFVYPLEIAMGYHSGNKNIHEIIQTADEKMYEHKLSMKSHRK